MNRIQQVDLAQISGKTKHLFDAKCKTLAHPIMKQSLIVFALWALTANKSSATVTNFPSDRVGGDLKTFHPGMRVWVEKATHKVNVESNGIILKGYDPVAHFTQKKAVKGSSKYQSAYQGAICRSIILSHFQARKASWWLSRVGPIAPHFGQVP